MVELSFILGVCFFILVFKDYVGYICGLFKFGEGVFGLGFVLDFIVYS